MSRKILVGATDVSGRSLQYCPISASGTKRTSKRFTLGEATALNRLHARLVRYWIDNKRLDVILLKFLVGAAGFEPHDPQSPRHWSVSQLSMKHTKYHQLRGS